MGHDICPIGRHKLNTTSLEAFSRDFAQRMNVNIEYGYWDEYSFNPDTGEEKHTMDYVVLGRINIPDAETTLEVFDNYYQIHLLWEQHGDKLPELAYFKHYPWRLDHFLQARNSVWYELRDKQSGDDWGDAYNHTFHCRLFYLCRWWHFCRYFNKYDTWGKEFDSLNAFRTDLMHFFAKLGGHEMVFVDDQGPSAYILYNDDEWDNLLSECRTHIGEEFFHIPRFMAHKQLLPADVYPLAFYDDFSDLQTP